MPTPPAADPRPTNNDISHLNTLSMVYYIAAGVLLLFAIFQIIALSAMFTTVSSMQSGMHVQVTHSMNGGTIMTHAPHPATQSTFSGLFVFFAFVMGLIGPILLALSGFFLKKHINYTFSMIIAVLACLAFPLGTVLGVFTLIVLCRDSVKELYNRRVF